MNTKKKNAILANLAAAALKQGSTLERPITLREGTVREASKGKVAK